MDPYGQVTTLSGSAEDGSMTISEPAGRSLEVVYRPILNSTEGHVSDVVVSYVQEYLGPGQPGRRVDYSYSAFPANSGAYTSLTGVAYFGSLSAVYTYQSNNAVANGRPLVATCDDAMYAGPMHAIAYDFVPQGGDGVLLREKHLNGSVVSSLWISGNSRTETRGDFVNDLNPSRTFTYSGGFLTNWTDFAGNVYQQGRTGGFVTSSRDPRDLAQPGLYTTDYGRNSVGNITSVTYPLTPSDAPPNGNGARATVLTGYSPDNPYFPISVTDERSNQTAYTRDPNTHRVTAIDYPDTGREEFVYNNYGQVTRHLRKNGSYEHFEYDSRGLLIHRWNPVTFSTQPTGNEPKTTISYYAVGDPWQDRVQSVTDPRQNPTLYEYERNASGTPAVGRGLVSKITHPDTKYRSFTYDRVGNMTHAENELRQPVDYAYDEYSRVTSVTTPHPNASNPFVADGTVSAFYDYAPSVGGDPYTRTARAATTATSAAGIVTTSVYDADVRPLSVTATNPGGVPATTAFHYELAGNQDWVTDPRLKTTTTAFDPRNRKTGTTSPVVTLADGSVTQYMTQWLYDPASNVRKIILPDSTTAQPKEINRDYDPMNRLWHSWDQMNRLTTNTYFASGMLNSVLDPKSRLTSFEYDERDLEKKMTYPAPDGRGG
ncbi:MAG: hypothetical protein ACR2ID_12025, partial [Chthoniobacterales bacterium]